MSQSLSNEELRKKAFIILNQYSSSNQLSINNINHRINLPRVQDRSRLIHALRNIFEIYRLPLNDETLRGIMRKVTGNGNIEVTNETPDVINLTTNETPGGKKMKKRRRKSKKRTNKRTNKKSKKRTNKKSKKRTKK